MGQPLSTVPQEVFRNDEAVTLPGGAEQAKAVEKVVRLCEALDNAGWLDVFISVVEQRNALLSVLADEAAKPAAVQAVKSIVGLGQAVTSVNSDALTAAMQGISNGLNHIGHDGLEVKGIWDVLKASRDPDVSRAFSAILTVLKSMGEHLQNLNP
ncbi:DUF1641 domain-containing protein [Alicyclobacillus ferrooxydans]|uniref:DUF1641 domain-containing protein n=1 Tax=Alicyclobacillus ferrooxydans TaxID=471514 RepID=A0A0N8PQ05_9BACL|nr:DUF1641 domain-containing protein [Alicyclobacillus ferrooxydans]KPV45781.1 hypothetical protein AN477_00150 [Alicyclobacillus ferrooxydans]